MIRVPAISANITIHMFWFGYTHPFILADIPLAVRFIQYAHYCLATIVYRIVISRYLSK